jgi:hypothetical protein
LCPLATLLGKSDGDDDWQTVRFDRLGVFHPPGCVRSQEVEPDFNDVAITIRYSSKLYQCFRLGDCPHNAGNATQRKLAEPCLTASHQPPW